MVTLVSWQCDTTDGRGGPNWVWPYLRNGLELGEKKLHGDISHT